jgi:hypothetical protein
MPPQTTADARTVARVNFPPYLGDYDVISNKHGELKCYGCAFCTKRYPTLRDLQEHCQHSGVHAWCNRCKKAFANEEKRKTHVERSIRHNVCEVCSEDYPRLADLEEHWDECHPECKKCGQWFRNKNNLRMVSPPIFLFCPASMVQIVDERLVSQHMRSHMAKNVICRGCRRRFPTNSALLIHLESGNCPSGADGDFIRRLAERYHQSAQYLTSRTHGRLFCPHCKHKITTVSGLFQHAGMRLDCAAFFAPGIPNVLTQLMSYIELNVEELSLVPSYTVEVWL